MKDQNLNSVFLFKLEHANKLFRKYKNRIFKEKGIDITSDQWILLKNIHEQKGINQTELGQRSRKEAAAVTRTLDILVRKGWITRQPNPESRRVYNLYPTTAGEEMVTRILPVALDVREQASIGFSTDEMTQLNALLDRICQNLE